MLIYAPVFIIVKAYSILHPCSHYTQHIIILHIIYTHRHSTGEVSRVALNSSFSPVCSSTESSGSGPSHDQATVNSSVSELEDPEADDQVVSLLTVNSSVSELEDPEADDQVVSLLSKLRAPRPSILASHTLSGSGLRDHRLVEARAYSRKTSRLFPFYALHFLCTGNYAGIIDASLQLAIAAACFARTHTLTIRHK
jgi:hypothetical protein